MTFLEELGHKQSSAAPHSRDPLLDLVLARQLATLPRIPVDVRRHGPPLSSTGPAALLPPLASPILPARAFACLAGLTPLSPVDSVPPVFPQEGPADVSLAAAHRTEAHSGGRTCGRESSSSEESDEDASERSAITETDSDA